MKVEVIAYTPDAERLIERAMRICHGGDLNADNTINKTFIQNVINGVDSLKEQRTKFINEMLMPKGSPSQNIVDDILDSIDNGYPVNGVSENLFL